MVTTDPLPKTSIVAYSFPLAHSTAAGNGTSTNGMAPAPRVIVKVAHGYDLVSRAGLARFGLRLARVTD